MKNEYSQSFSNGLQDTHCILNMWTAFIFYFIIFFYSTVKIKSEIYIWT